MQGGSTTAPRSTELRHPCAWDSGAAVTERASGRDDALVSLVRRLLSSLAIVAAAAGLIAFATLGAFDNHQDPFPHSVLSR